MDSGEKRTRLGGIFWILLGLLCGLVVLRLWGPALGVYHSARAPRLRAVGAEPAGFEGLPYSDLPGVDLAGLSREQKFTLLHRAVAEPCTCGCKENVAQCRHSDMNCDTSLALALQLRREVVAAGPSTPLAPGH